MENPSQRSFFGVLKTIFQSKTANLLVLLLIVAAVPLTVFVAQQRQETRQRAEVKVQQQSNSEIAYGSSQTTTKEVLPASTSRVVCRCVPASSFPIFVSYKWEDAVEGGCQSIDLRKDNSCAPLPLFDYASCLCNSDAKVDESIPPACRKEKGSACGTVQAPPPPSSQNPCVNETTGENSPRGTSCYDSGSGTLKECDGNGRCNQTPAQNPCVNETTGENSPRGISCYDSSSGTLKQCDGNGSCNLTPPGPVDPGVPPPAGGIPGDGVTCNECTKVREFNQCGGVLHNNCSGQGTEADSKNLIKVEEYDCGDNGTRYNTEDISGDEQCGGTGGELPERVPPAPPSLSGENDLKPQCGPSYPNNKLFAKWNISGSNCDVYIRGGTTDTTINDGGACSGQKTIEQVGGARITNDGVYSLFVSNGSQTIEKGPVKLNCQPAPSAPPASCNPSAVNMTVVPDDSTKTEIKVGDNIRFNVSGSQGDTWISEQGLSGFTDCTGGIWGNKICKALKEGQDIAWTHNWKNCAGSAANCPVTCAKNAKFTIKSSASAIPACDKSKVTMTAKSVEDPASSDIFVNDNIKFNVTGEQGSTHPQDIIDQNPTGVIDYTNGGYFGTSNFKAQKTGVITWVHKWKNCGGTTSNCSDMVCTSDPVLVNVKPAPNFKVEGVIFNDTDGNKEQGTGETGMPGIIVKLTNEDTNANFTAGATDATGRFVFESIPRGNRYKGEITNIPANNYVTVNYPVRTSIRANVTGFKIGIRQNPTNAKEIKGKLNAVSDCNAGITGYACIPNETSTQLNVDIFDYSGAKLGTAKADKQNSTSECQGSHKFVFDVPSLLKDGNPHSIYAHAINIINGQNPELTGSPQTFTCANPAELDGEEGINIGDFNVLLSKYKSKENINYCTTSRSNICSYPNNDGFIDLRSFGLWFIDAYPFLH